MKQARSDNSINCRALWVILLIGLGLQGCQNSRHMVLASTATNIGVEVSQNPATQSPQAKLGYQRAELAIVPSNRTTKDDVTNATSMGQGAKDVADVVMELRYGGIFDLGASSGIYQRLAVGSIAVTQPGASLMFSKDADGAVTPHATEALKSLTSVKATDPKMTEIKYCLSELRKSNESTKGKIDASINKAMSMTWDKFTASEPSSAQIKGLLDDLNGQGITCP